MRYVVAATLFWTLTASSASAFYQPTILFDKWIFWGIEEFETSNAAEKTEQESTKKWRIVFTNPMS